MKKISVEDFVNDNSFLKKLNEVDFGNKKIEVAEISRPGIELTGYFEYFSERRPQLYGLQETEYLKKHDISDALIEKLLPQEVPFIVFSRNLEPSEKFLKIATKNKIPVFNTELITSKIFSVLFEYLEDKLAPETQIHGVMMSIYGKGILIQGQSGIGKSEVALELIKKGHYLVADDSVVLRKIDSDTLVASAPELLKNRIEIRGIGIVDIQKLYGVTSVLAEQKLDLLIYLTDKVENIDRIGNINNEEKLLDVKKPKITIPVLSGKNISNLIEVAVANFQLKEEYNYDSSKSFIEDLDNLLKKKGKNKDGID